MDCRTTTGQCKIYVTDKMHSCARILTNGSPNLYSTIVVGGSGIPGPMASVEILDDGAAAWRAGPTFPISINSNVYMYGFLIVPNLPLHRVFKFDNSKPK